MVLSLKSIWLLLSLVQFSILVDSKHESQLNVLSRRKRYVAFPEGSSFSTAGCMTVGLIGQPAPSSSPGTFTWGMNWAIAYELPNATETTNYYKVKTHLYNRNRKPVQQRRSRRELYEKLEVILDKYGILNEYKPPPFEHYDARLHAFCIKPLPEIFSRSSVELVGSYLMMRPDWCNDMGYSGRQCILKTLCETTQRIVPHGENMVEEIFRTLFSMPAAKLLPIEPAEHAIYDSAHRLGRLLESCDQFTCPISLVDWVKGYYNAPAPSVDTARNPWALFSSNSF